MFLQFFTPKFAAAFIWSEKVIIRLKDQIFYHKRDSS